MITMDIKINEKILDSVLNESVHDVIKEDVEDQAVETKCDEYAQILRNEYEQAQRAVRASRPTFHNGLRDAMQRHGFTTVGHGDNWTGFYGPSRLFYFSAHQDYNGGWQSPWILSQKVGICIEKYGWSSILPHNRRANAEHGIYDVSVNEFEEFYTNACNRVHDVIEISKHQTPMERVETFSKFTVYKGGGGRYQTIWEYDNFEDAKKRAYDLAQEECTKGKERRDDISRYYHSKPVDITNNHPHDIIAFEFYLYDEYSYYVAVSGE
jgi:hypothetical protein